ncbi:MAG: N-acetylmuramic acid 6-phosphate etherase [Eubacteriales bacterium]|nr:N-acetylmuramic acid 6-phosphate etherase [bacterium]MDY2792680.1 N-acetylmuramic acid 6-phosphate etherase [Eubacteriales bacterium]
MAAEGVSQLHTEQRNPNTLGIDRMTTAQILRKINDEDQTVAGKVREALPQVEKAVDLLTERMRRGGRLVYVGAGTSGRLGFMDAAECAPTYGLPDAVACVMAGGRDAVFKAQESLEDDGARAARDLNDWGLIERDVVVAAAASGRTPYCIGALDYARSIGAGTVSIACNPHSEMAAHAQIAIEVDTGCEVIMGSTRMKAGTAQKLVMNMLSTAVMIRLGRTCDNLMVCLHAKNEKLVNRVARLYREATGEGDPLRAEEALCAAHGRLDVAILMQKTGASFDEACSAMDEHGNFGQALLKLTGATC